MSDDLDNLLPFPEGGLDPRVIDLLPVVEALLFAAGTPVRVVDLAEALGGADPGTVAAAVDALSRRLAKSDRGVELVSVAGGWQMRTDPRFSDPVLRLLGARPQKLSRASLEVLAVVAYQQPVTRQEVEAIRGVDCGGVMRSLLSKGLLRVSGRRDIPGRPLEYRTTSTFLELFGLPALDHLPTLREREELDPDV